MGSPELKIEQREIFPDRDSGTITNQPYRLNNVFSQRFLRYPNQHTPEEGWKFNRRNILILITQMMTLDLPRKV